MILRSALVPLVAIASSLLFACGGSTTISGPDGSCVWVTPVSNQPPFNKFCGQPCAVTPDCPAGWLCVVGAMGAPMTPVCVSDNVPEPLPQDDSWIIDAKRSKCFDANTLGRLYQNFHTGICGYELTACPNGCTKSPDGGYSADSCN